MTISVQTAEKRLELITKARELISDPAGWIKGQMFDDNAYYSGKVCARCAWGALWEADQGDDVTNAAAPLQWTVLDAKQWLEEVLLDSEMGLHRFNDRDDTTHDDILRFFDRGIILARAELERARHDEIPVQLNSACRFSDDDDRKACWNEPEEDDDYNPIPASTVAAIFFVMVFIATLLYYALGGS